MKMNKLTQYLLPCFMMAACAQATAKSEAPVATEEQPLLAAEGFYIGGQVGYAKTDISAQNLDDLYQSAGLTSASTSVKDDDFSYSLFLGYKFNRYFSIEAGFQDLGERNVYFSGQTIDYDAYYDLAEHVYPETGNGYSLSLLGTLPLTDEFNLTGKIGYFDWEMDGVTSDFVGNGPLTQQGDDERSGRDIWYGAEVSYQIDYDLQAYLSYQHMPLQTDDVGVLSLGVRYWFSDEDDYVAKPAPTPTPAPVVAKDSDNDGVIDANDACPATAITHKVGVDGCTLFAPKVVEMGLTVLYANDSDKVAATYHDKIQKLANFINEYNVENLAVIGHTSRSGTEAYNQKLSEKRAQAVADVLVSQFGIKRDVITVIGKGESEPVSAVASENRRIQVYLKEEVSLPVLK